MIQTKVVTKALVHAGLEGMARLIEQEINAGGVVSVDPFSVGWDGDDYFVVLVLTLEEMETDPGRGKGWR